MGIGNKRIPSGKKHILQTSSDNHFSSSLRGIGNKMIPNWKQNFDPDNS